MLDGGGEALYVGKARSLKKRVTKLYPGRQAPGPPDADDRRDRGDGVRGDELRRSRRCAGSQPDKAPSARATRAALRDDKTFPQILIHRRSFLPPRSPSIAAPRRGRAILRAVRLGRGGQPTINRPAASLFCAATAPKRSSGPAPAPACNTRSSRCKRRLASAMSARRNTAAGRPGERLPLRQVAEKCGAHSPRQWSRRRRPGSSRTAAAAGATGFGPCRRSRRKQESMSRASRTPTPWPPTRRAARPASRSTLPRRTQLRQPGPTFLSHEQGPRTRRSLAASGQFYDDKPPAEGDPAQATQPPEADLLAEGASIKADRRVRLSAPRRGDRRPADRTNALANAARRWAAAGRKRLPRRLLEGGGGGGSTLESAGTGSRSTTTATPGTNDIGAMIVAGPEGLAKNAYRKLNIKGEKIIAAGDDYAMMREVLTRRFSPRSGRTPDRSGAPMGRSGC